MDEPSFDIFRGTSDKDALWLEAVSGLSKARQRVGEIAAAKPGQYFVCGSSSHSIRMRIDSSKSVQPLIEPKAKTA
jgi:hypothetical protein